MKYLILLILTSVPLNSALSAEYHKAGWTNSKVETESQQCAKTFNKDLCSQAKLTKVQRKICTKPGLRTFCGCLSNVMGSLLTYKEYKDKPQVTSKTMQDSGAFDRCLDDVMK